MSGIRIINGDDGEIGLFMKKLPTGKDGWVDVEYQPPVESFVQVIKGLFRRSTNIIRNVPESSILGPVQIGKPGDQKLVMFMTQGENGSSKLLDELGILQNRTVTALRGQLQDEIIRAQSAEEEKTKVLKGAKVTQKYLADLKPTERKRFPFRGRPDEQDEEYY